jgi:hypothetical protein
MDVTMVVFCRVCLRSCVGCWSIVVFCHRKHALPVVCCCVLPGKWFMHPYWVSCLGSFYELIASVNACSTLLQRRIVGWVFTVFFGCCILFLGSAIGCWLFAATVYWMFGSVAWLLVGWWPSGWMWVMRCLLVGFFFFLGHRPLHVHDTALVSLWGCLQSVCFG